jgi:two-component system sensor histidine kinase DesK
LAQRESDIALTIEDDGQRQSIPRYGNGLTGMQERLHAVNGTLEVTCPKRHGLRLDIRVPIEDTERL